MSTRLAANLHGDGSLLLAAFEGSRVGVSLRYADDRRILINDGLEKMLGYSRKELEAGRFNRITHPEDRPLAAQLMDSLRRGESDSVRSTKRLLRKDGSFIWVVAEGWVCRDEDGRILFYFFVNQDITEAKLAQEKLALQANLLSSTFDSIAQGLVVFDGDGRLALWNGKYAKMFGFPNGFLRTGLTYAQVTWKRLLLEERESEEIETIVRRRVTQSMVRENRAGEGVTAKGLHFVYNRQIVPGSGFLDTFTDVTAFKRLEKETAEKQTILEATFDHMIQGVAIFGPDGVLRASNRQFQEIMSLPGDARTKGMKDRDMLRQFVVKGMFGDADPAHLYIDLAKALEEDEKFSAEMRRADGTYYVWYCAPTPDGGRIHTITDTTERRCAEEKLHQAQKMEVVGQLTGGVAHDFNNLLAVILGHVELALDHAGDRQELRDSLKAIQKAGLLGASLTQQLLAFSRRSVLNPVTIDVATHILAMKDMLSRSLGEEIEVRMAVQQPGLLVHVDTAQLSNAILNLSVNARDVMPEGGVLSFDVSRLDLAETLDGFVEGLRAGSYAVVRVGDTGHGMTPSVKARAIEPFFTTKDVGKGSGLGLSMVAGFIGQSGGELSIDSAPGQGTAVTLFLPLSKEAAVARPTSRDTRTVPGSGETVLVVEDDIELRNLTVKMLEQLGYVVRSAASANEALLGLEKQGVPDILLSDVVLGGGQSGVDLAQAARRRFPSIRILFMSGYPSQLIWANSGMPDMKILSKPFDRASLSIKLREILS
jgi:PAS domain S-box-containing protein